MSGISKYMNHKSSNAFFKRCMEIQKANFILSGIQHVNVGTYGNLGLEFLSSWLVYATGKWR